MPLGASNHNDKPDHLDNGSNTDNRGPDNVSAKSKGLIDLNETFHVKARLGIMTLLLMGEADFSTLKAKLELTDGNLGAHIRVLEEAGYVKVEKGFAGRRPRTVVSITDQGRQAFSDYLEQLESVIRMARA
ncbi:MAG: transcriptional regulator [Abitibacteriaceae bacterium]|nr:transcriptional regulator [Abditibacteriaceae bacterium]